MHPWTTIILTSALLLSALLGCGSDNENTLVGCVLLSEDEVDPSADAYGQTVAARIEQTWPEAPFPVALDQEDQRRWHDTWTLSYTVGTVSVQSYHAHPGVSDCPAEVVHAEVEVEIQGTSGLQATGTGSVTWSNTGDTWAGYELETSVPSAWEPTDLGCFPDGGYDLWLSGPGPEFAPGMAPVQNGIGLIVARGESCAEAAFRWRVASD